MSARIRATMKASAGRLTLAERMMLLLLESHDRTKFNPSIALLAEDYYGRSDRRTREEVRQILDRLEAKGEIRREYRHKTNGSPGYSHMWLRSDDNPSGATPALSAIDDGSTPSSDGSSPSSDGGTPGTKSNKAKENNAAMPEEVSVFVESAWRDYQADIAAEVWSPVLAELLDDGYTWSEMARGYVWFRDERGEKVTAAKHPDRYLLRTLPAYVAENIVPIREAIEGEKADG